MEASGGNDEFVFCGACGARLDAGVRFCTSCGTSQAQFSEDESEHPAGDATPAGEKAGGDALANAPTEAMPAGSSPQPATGGQGTPPPPPVPPTTPGAQPGGQRNFLESLFDIKFEHLITPKLVRFFYALSIVVLGVGALLMIVAAFEAGETTGIVVFFLAPISALFYLIMIRLWLELIVVAFKIRDAVERVAENTERSDA